MAISNGLNPYVERLELPGNVIITSGAATDSASIILDLGTPGTDVGEGTIYITNSTGTPKIFIAATSPTEWISLTLN